VTDYAELEKRLRAEVTWLRDYVEGGDDARILAELGEAADAIAALIRAKQERDDLAMLMHQLIYRNNKGLTLDERLAAAGEYMTSKKLNGSVLRDEHGDCLSTAPAEQVQGQGEK
jgi:hypothetical protein